MVKLIINIKLLSRDRVLATPVFFSNHILKHDGSILYHHNDFFMYKMENFSFQRNHILLPKSLPEQNLPTHICHYFTPDDRKERLKNIYYHLTLFGKDEKIFGIHAKDSNIVFKGSSWYLY